MSYGADWNQSLHGTTELVIEGDAMNEQRSLWDAPPAPAQPDGRALRDDGIRRAVAHANAVSPSWGDVALQYVEAYARSHSHMTAEAVRMYAEARGFPKPPDNRAWGSAMTRAARAGFIVKTRDHDEATDPKCHCRPVRVWAAVRA